MAQEKFPATPNIIVELFRHLEEKFLLGIMYGSVFIVNILIFMCEATAELDCRNRFIILFQTRSRVNKTTYTPTVVSFSQFPYATSQKD